MHEQVYWNQEIETKPRAELKKQQDRDLRALVNRVYDNVPFYRQKMDALNVKPADIKGVEDLPLLPFTDKSDLRNNYPFGLFAVPRKEIVRIHASSGTTGKPTVAGYTRKDIELWAEVMARSLSCAGVTRDSVLHVAYGYGLFTGGLGAHYGGERIGASVIPVSGGNTSRQLTLLQDFGATCICCTPSYALNIAESIKQAGIPPERFSLQSGIFGAEPWTEGMRAHLEKMLGIVAHDIYGLTEIMGPGVAMECKAQQGLHVWEDAFLPEVIDKEGRQLPEGQEGELVFTTLTKEGMPLIRYRTHDVTSLTSEPCSCGRTHIRMARVRARTDDMLIIRGVNIFPSQVEHSLLSIPGVVPQYQLLITRQGNLDALEVQVEMDPHLISDTVRDLEALRDRIVHKLSEDILIHAKVKLCQPGSLPRSEGKAKRVMDMRNMD